MTSFAQHVRIFNADPSDDLVTKRQESVNTLADAFKTRRGYPSLLSLADDIAGLFVKAPLSEALATQVISAVSGPSPSFDGVGHEIEVSACAALAALACLESANGSSGTASRSDIIALGLWSALAFQEQCPDTKLERLRQSILTAARDLVLKSSETARQRTTVSDPAINVDESDEISTLSIKLKDGPIKAVSALRTNAALDREELDILWWALADWSQILKARISKLNDPTGAVVSGIEVAHLLRRLPAEAYRHVVLRHVTNVSVKLSLTELLSELGESRVDIQALYANTTILESSSRVFPLLASLKAPSHKLSEHGVPRTLDEWAARALLEASIINLSTLPTVIS